MLGLSKLEFLDGKYSSKCTDSNGRTATCPHKLSLKQKQQKCKDMFNENVEGKLNRSTSNEIIKPINSNADADDLFLKTDFVRRKITTNYSQEENVYAYLRNRELIDANASLDFPKCTMSKRKISIFTNVVAQFI